MVAILIRKSTLILSLFTVLFLVSYILFLSLATSLDFKIEALAAKKLELEEEREELLAKVVAAQGREALTTAGASLNLVEATWADGYVDLRPSAIGWAENLAKKQ